MSAPPVSAFGGTVGQEGTDSAWIIVCGFIVFTMQAGFGLLESGMVSRRSEANVMVKNMLDVSIGGIAYWFVGYGFSFGENTKPSKTMSGESLFITDVEIDGEDASTYIIYFFQLSFATAATTIVSGAVAERIKLDSYIIFAIINTALIYPFCVRWVWHADGFFYGLVHDFAGSCVVHMCGGAAAFAGCIILGPRKGRFTKDKAYFAFASPTNVVLGTFFLWFGWIGFNCGSALGITGSNWRIVGRIAVITMNGAMAGGAAVLIYNLILHFTKIRAYLIDIGEFTGGLLGGLVAITAAANAIRPWEALVIGFFGGLSVIAWEALMEKLKIDDPVGCVAVHWAAGLWGMIAAAFFVEKGDPTTDRWNGIFRGGSGEVLGWNILCCIVITAWSFGLGAIVFGTLHLTIGLRMSEEDELKGSDAVEHGINDDPVGSHILGKKIDSPAPVLASANKGIEMEATA